MNEKELGELRRRFRPEKSAISHVRGCYVNEKREIISQFDQSLALMGQEESGKVLELLRKTLSGALERNLLNVEFTTRQVVEGAEHQRLMKLKNSQLADEEAVEELFRQIIASADIEGNYLILLAFDSYDVPFRSKDGERQLDASEEVFSYMVCAVCPVKLTKEALSYFVQDRQFHTLSADWVISAPELGFLFPAFDQRATNLYQALCYTRDITKSREAFIDAIFHTPAPMPAATQMECFQDLLSDTLEQDCSYQVVQAVQDSLCGWIETHKAEKIEQPLTVSKGAVKQVLRTCGVEEEHIEAFEERYDDVYGADAEVNPKNLLDTKRLELKTPDVTIQVAAGRGDLVETRIIDGARYILIRAEEGVEVNGVAVNIR